MIRAIILVLALAAALSDSGCAGLSGGGRGGAFCDVARPVRPSEKAVDAMSAAEVRAALAQNKYGARACGWKAGVP